MSSRFASDRWKVFERKTAWVLISILIVGLLLTACEPEPPTATPIPTIAGALIPTAEVIPILPSAPGATLENRLEFTPGASLTLPPQPPSAQVPLSVAVRDVIFSGTLWRAVTPLGVAGTGTVLLLHGADSTRSGWGTLPQALQDAGYNVIAFDWRGYGKTGGALGWDAAVADLGVILRSIRSLPGIDSNRFYFIGSGAGGTLALIGCAAEIGCRTVSAISPLARYGKLDARTSIPKLAGRPLFFVVSVEDDPSALDAGTLANGSTGEKQIQRYVGRAHGAALLAAQPGIESLIIAWLRAHV